MSLKLGTRFTSYLCSLGTLCLIFGLQTGLAATSKSGSIKKFPESMGTIPEHYSKVKFPDFTYTAPYPQDFRVTLDRGVVAYLVPDTTLALIQMSILFGQPILPKKPAQVASLNLYSTLLKSGGTLRFTPEQLEDSLEFVAASLAASISDFQSSLGLDALQKDAYALFDLLPELALKPRFDPEVFKVQKRTYLENIRHRYDTPKGVMNIAYEHLLYGSHPSNWMATEKEVEAVTVNHLKTWTGKGFSLQNMVIGVAGQFERKEMIAKLNQLIAQFPADSKGVSDSVPAFLGPVKPGVYIIDKEVSQATIKLGAPGVKRPHVDYYPLVLASYIFGDGGFTSRLVEKVRSNEGLVYGIDSDVGSDYNRAATVGVSLQTKVETAAYALKIILDEMRKLAKDGITDEELQRAKDGLIKSLPSMFDTPASTARIFAQGEIWKRSPDHYKDYVETIQKLTKNDVVTAFQKYFIADSMRIVIVGAKDALMKKDERGLTLADFGSVKFLTLEEIETRK